MALPCASSRYPLETCLARQAWLRSIDAKVGQCTGSKRIQDVPAGVQEEKCWNDCSDTKESNARRRGQSCPPQSRRAPNDRRIQTDLRGPAKVQCTGEIACAKAPVL